MKKKANIIIREFLGTINGEANLQEIKMGESPFIHILAALNGVEVTDNMEMKSLIKTSITESVVVVDGMNYHFYISTSSQMKNNTAFFIREDQIEKVKMLETLVSDGKIDTLKDVNINKDVVARLSLLHTGSYKTSVKPNVIILPDVDYSVFKNVKVLENGELVNKDNFEISQTAFDGCGLMSNEIAEMIQSDLAMKYTPAFVTCRMPKMAVKGLLTNVNFQQYFEDHYTNYTETFKKVGQYFFIKDVFGDFIKVDKNTIIINESMAKWSKYYKSINDFDSKGLEGLLECLYVSKIAKKEAKAFTNTSYQSLNAMAITPIDYYNMANPVINFYHRCLDLDKGAILELLNVIQNTSFENEDDNVEAKTLSDKIAVLLSDNYEQNIQLKWIQSRLVNMIEKKIQELMSGRVLIEGNFKVCVADPIAFMNFAMTGQLISELKKSEFYVKGETGKVATMRFPIAMPQELTVESLTSNEKMDRYCNFTNEMIVINQVGIDALIKSGCDFDGDTWQVTSNECIINSIIPCDRTFINVGDLEKKDNKVEYTWENRMKQNKEFAGNIIGQIAIASSSLGNKCQQNNLYVYNGKKLSYKEFEDKYPSVEDRYNFRIDKVVSNEEMREYIKNRFAEEEVRFAKLLELSMTAIDAPKTAILPNMDDFKALTEDLRNPYFFKFLPKKEYNENMLSETGSVLTSQCKFLENTLFRRERAAIKVTRYADVQLQNVLQSNLLESHNTDTAKVIKDIVSNHIVSINDMLSTEEEKMSMTEKEKIEENQKIKLKQMILSENIKSRFNKSDINAAMYLLSMNGKSKVQNYILDFYFESVKEASRIANPTTERMIENINGEYNGMFKRYDIIKFENLNAGEENSNKKEMKRLMDKFNIRISILSDIIEGQDAEIQNLDVIQNGVIVGKVFADSIIKQGRSIEEVQGIGQILKLEVSPSKKSGAIILG